MMPNSQLERSYALCREIARRSGSSFFWSFYLLPPQRRTAMQVLYAFLRRVDDVADEPDPTRPETGESTADRYSRHDTEPPRRTATRDRDNSAEARRARLSQWRQGLEQAVAGNPLPTGIWPALADIIEQYALPAAPLHAALDGALIDIARPRFATLDELYDYCDLVSTSVGRSSLAIWGAPEAASLPATACCGRAIQLTNILRDVREDAEQGRVYLPEVDLQRVGCRYEQLRAGRSDRAFCALMELEIGRAEKLYDDATPLVASLPVEAQPICRAILQTYGQLLRRIKECPERVLRQRVRVPHWERIWIVGRESFRGRPWLFARQRSRSARP